MADLKLSGAERRRIVEVLESTYGDTEELRWLIQQHTPEIAPRIHWKQATLPVLYHVVERAEQYGVTSELLFAAAKERPNRPDFLAVVIELCQGKSGRVTANVYGSQFEEVVHPFAGFLDPTELATKLLCHERHICAIEAGDGAGTGLLVASDLVLTNHHVVEKLIAGAVRHDEVTCVFDYRVDFDGTPTIPTRIGIDPSWTIPHRRHETHDVAAPHELDYAFLKLERPLGGEKPKGEDRPRCWFDLSQPPPEPVRERLAFVLQHPRNEMWRPGEPRQQPLRVAVGQPGFDGYNANHTRLRYRVNTLPGSSGSAVFDERLRLVALHSSRGAALGTADGRVVNNQGIPLKAILADVEPRVRGMLAKPACRC